MTRRRILFIIIPSFLLICFVFGYLFISSEYFLNTYIRSRLLQALKDQINKEEYDVEIGDLRGNVLKGVVIENLKIKEKNIDLPPILSTEKVLFEYNIFSLLRSQFLVKALVIDSPNVYVERNTDGELNLSRMLQKSTSETKPDTNSDFAFAVAKVTLNEGTILYSDPQQNIRLNLPDISISLNGQVEKWEHKGSFSIGKGSFKINDTEIPIEQLDEMQFAISNDSSEIPNKYTLKIGNSLINIIDFERKWGNGDWKTEIEMNIDTKDVQKFIDSNLELSGFASINMNLKGTDSTINGSILCKSDKLSFKQILASVNGQSKPYARQIDITGISVDTSIDNEHEPKITLNEFTATIADGTLSGNGSISFDNNIEGNLFDRIQHYLEQPISYDSKWSLSDIQLPTLISMLVELPDDLPEFNSGSINGSAEIRCNTAGELHLDGNVKLVKTHIIVDENEQKQTYSLKDSVLDYEIVLDIGKESVIAANGNIDNTTVEIGGSLDNIEVKLTDIDFGKLCKMLKTVPFTGIGNLSATIMQDGTANGYAEIPKAYYGNLNSLLGRLTGNLRYQDNVLYIDDGLLTKNSDNGITHISIDGDIRLEGKLPSNFTIQVTPLVLDKDYNNIFFQQEYPIMGEISGELDLFGSLIDNLDGKGTFTVESGNAWGINLDTATLPLEIEDYSLTIHNFKINAQGQQVILNAHATDDGEFDFSLKNSKDKPVQLAKLALAADVPDFPLDGKMDVDVTSYLRKNENVVFNIALQFPKLTFEGNPLGDAVLHGTLIDNSENADEPDFFNFTGEAFEGTSNIIGRIYTTQDSPYHFTMHSEAIQVSPILRIFDSRFENITGTADVTTEVAGTITELVEPTRERLFPYVVDVNVKETDLQYNSVQFTNTRPIHLKLESDILTIQDSSFIFTGEQTSFVELSGTFDTKNEQIDFFARSEEEFSLNPIGVAFGIPIDGKVSYQLNASGPLNNMDIQLKWQLPTLNINTNVGEVYVHNADGTLVYKNGSVLIEPFSIDFMENRVLVGGDITINKEELSHSILNLDIRCESLDIEKLHELLTNSISAEMVKQLSLENEASVSGVLGISAKLSGNIGEPTIKVDAHSISDNPILLGRITDPITFDKLGAEILIKKQSIQIQDAVLHGKMGDGDIHINGDTFLSTTNTDDMNFNLSVSTKNLDLQDFAALFHENRILHKVLLSGSINCSGTGIKPNQISVTGNINELILRYQNYELKNKTTIDISLDRNEIRSFIPLQITSPEIDTYVDIRLDGLLSAPILSIIWQGAINYLSQNQTNSPLQWIGRADYDNSIIELSSKLTNNGDNLELKGTLPFNLSVLEANFIAQFTEKPIDVSLFSNELPLNSIPGLDRIFMQVDGVVDINMRLQGTISEPQLEGTFSIEAPNLEIRDFPQTFENVSIQFNAQDDIIELTKFQFDIEDGTVFLNQDRRSTLTLEGITPKNLEVYNLTLNRYPIVSSLHQNIPEDIAKDIEGTVSATLIRVSIPLHSYFENKIKNPIPILHDSITFESITQNAEADFTIDNLSMGFTLLDQKYKLENPQPIPISLTSGEFKVRELKLENIHDVVSNNPYPLTFSSYGRWNMQNEILLNMKLTNFDLSTLNSLFSNINLDTYDLNGIITTDINIHGTITNPEITVVFNGDRIKLNAANFEVFKGEVSYSSVDRRWSVAKSNPVRLRSGKNLLTCSGEFPYYLSFSELRSEVINEPMEFLIALELDEIGILSVIAPEIEAANGVGSISATLQGMPNSPHLNGTGYFDLESLLLKDSPIYLNDTRGDFEFSETELRIISVDGQLNAGDFVVRGKINTDWFNVHAIDLYASMDNCNIVEPGQYEVNVSTATNDLHLSGDISKNSQRNLRLLGDVVIHSGNYEQNWENVRDWFSGSTVSGVELTFGNTLLDNLQLDLGIDIPEDFHFLSSIGGSTDIEITCNGRITGLIQEPIFTGDVIILDGKISIVTQEFDIVEGSIITNHDDTGFNPHLDIILKTQNPIRGVLLEDGSTADLMVTATVTGVLENGDIDKARLSFHADPINSSSTAVFSDAFLLSLLLPGSSISRSFGGITFTLSSGFDPNERHIIAEYPLPRNMSIKVEGDERGDFGIDIQFLERRF